MFTYIYFFLESEDEVEEEPEERQPSPEPLQESPSSTTYYETHPVTYAKTSLYPLEYIMVWFPYMFLLFLNSGVDRMIIFFLYSNGVEEPMDEPAPEPEPEAEPEAKVEDVKPEADEKVLEEMEEKAPSPAPVESPPNAQEPPKVKIACLCGVLSSKNDLSGAMSLVSMDVYISKPKLLFVNVLQKDLSLFRSLYVVWFLETVVNIIIKC